MTAVNPIKYGIAKVLGAISNTKPMNGIINSYQKNFDKALAVTAVTSIIAKDSVGGVKYVTQSMHNEKIPDDKRPFVTSMDFSNSIIMILTQIGMFVLMRKYSESMFNTFFKKSFGNEAKNNMITRLRMIAAKHETQLRKLEANKQFESLRSDALSLFKFVFDVGIATIIGKRIITPFIATPVAKVVEKHVYPILVGEKKIKNNTQTKQKVETENNQRDVDNDDDDDIQKIDD